MKLTRLLSLLGIVKYVCALEKKGCNLIIPEEVEIREEPQPEKDPLIVDTSLEIKRLRDVTRSGGSFGIDVM